MFLPPICPACGHRLEGSAPLCMECLLAMERCTGVQCRALLEPVLSAAPCAAGVMACWTHYRHESTGAVAIRGVKYYNRPNSGVELGRIYARELVATREFDSPDGLRPVDLDLLLPVPLHWTKLLRRGYNQSRCIALGLAEVLNCRVGENLRAAKPHSTQTHRTATQRAANVSDIFCVDNPAELDGLNVAIVDDVVTTGATVNECVLAIGRSGARPASLSVLSLALAGGN